MTVWGISIGFHLHSKSLPFVPPAEDLESLYKCVLIIDIVLVNDQFQFFFEALDLFPIRRFASSGSLQNKPASLPGVVPADLVSSPR
jgi:hypothetical protein